jgi:hypothetical protein
MIREAKVSKLSRYLKAEEYSVVFSTNKKLRVYLDSNLGDRNWKIVSQSCLGNPVILRRRDTCKKEEMAN